MPQEQDWKAAGRSPQGPGCPQGAQDIPTAPCTHGDTCSTEPASACKHPAWKNTFHPQDSRQEQPCTKFTGECFLFFLQEKVALGPRDEDFGYLPLLSTPSLKFSRFFSKASEKLQFLQTSYVSALKGSSLVAKGKYIKICIYIYVSINAEILCVCTWPRPLQVPWSIKHFLLIFFHKKKHPGDPASCPKSMVLPGVPIPRL